MVGSWFCAPYSRSVCSFRNISLIDLTKFMPSSLVSDDAWSFFSDFCLWLTASEYGWFLRPLLAIWSSQEYKSHRCPMFISVPIWDLRKPTSVDSVHGRLQWFTTRCSLGWRFTNYDLEEWILHGLLDIRRSSYWTALGFILWWSVRLCLILISLLNHILVGVGTVQYTALCMNKLTITSAAYPWVERYEMLLHLTRAISSWIGAISAYSVSRPQHQMHSRFHSPQGSRFILDIRKLHRQPITVIGLSQLDAGVYAIEPSKDAESGSDIILDV